jgi:hypothetical protein
MSMSGRMSTDRGPGTVWNYGPLPAYAPDGTAQQGHGRRSSIYRAQNSTLFSAFEDDEREEDGVAMDDLEDVESDDGRDRKGAGPEGRRAEGMTQGQAAAGAGEGRSLVGKKMGTGR